MKTHLDFLKYKSEKRPISMVTCYDYSFGQSRRQAHQVLNHEDLPIAVEASADANGGNAQLGRDGLSQRSWHALKYDGKDPQILKSFRLVFDPLGLVTGAPLHLVTSQSQIRLRR